MRHFALIKGGIVQSVVFGNAEFAESIRGQYEQIVEVTDRTRPSPGDSYYPDQDAFHSNDAAIVHIKVDLTADHLNRGTEVGFKPFKLSKYNVSYEDGFIRIGCRKYSAHGFMDALHMILIEKQTSAHCFRTGKNPGHGKFDITWDDAQMLYDALSKVRL